MKMALTDKKAGLIMGLIAGTSWSTYGTFTTILGNQGFDAGTISLISPFFLIVMFLALSLANGGIRALKVPKKALPFIICDGLCSAIYNFAAVQAYLYLPIGVVSTIIYANLFCLLFICRFIWKDPITKQKLLAVGLAIFGVLLVANVFGAGGEGGMSLKGFIFAFMAMLSWSGLMTFETLAMERGVNPNAVCMYEGCFSFIIIGVTVSPAMILANIGTVFAAKGAIVLLPILGFGLITTMCAYFFYMHALNKVLPTYVEICYSLDPALSCVWGMIFFGQVLTGLQFLGIAIVLGAVIFEQTYEMRAENKRLAEESAPPPTEATK